jgi:hypothetical protein
MALGLPSWEASQLSCCLSLYCYQVIVPLDRGRELSVYRTLQKEKALVRRRAVCLLIGNGGGLALLTSNGSNSFFLSMALSGHSNTSLIAPRLPLGNC